MSLEEKIKYNRASAFDFGWSPEWFGLHIEQFDQRLIEIIEEFQFANDLDPDGMIGPSTFRRLYTYVSQDEAEHNIKIEAKENAKIIFRGKEYPIMWSKVVLWTDENGLKCKSKKSRKRAPSYFVNHWDVCLSSKQMTKVLSVRALGVHFAIDNDSTIYQLCDMEDLAFHAGGHNSKSIGVEISNAYSIDYNDWYEKKGFGKRPVINNAYVHGKRLKAHLGFYPDQIRALAALWAAVSCATGIPLQVPNSPDTVDHFAASGSFKGFCGHYHLTKRKIDPAGLDFHAVQDWASLIKVAMTKMNYGNYS
jgi:hypothetical protein